MKVRRINGMTLSVALLVAVFCVGCSTQAKRVDCEWRLKPINPPAKVVNE